MKTVSVPAFLFLNFFFPYLSSGSSKADKDVKKRGGGFTKLCSLSPQLQAFTGVSELARTEVIEAWILSSEVSVLIV